MLKQPRGHFPERKGGGGSVELGLGRPDFQSRGPKILAKSGNLNLFLGILLFFPLFSLQFSRKKGQNTQKKV